MRITTTQNDCSAERDQQLEQLTAIPPRKSKHACGHLLNKPMNWSTNDNRLFPRLIMNSLLQACAPEKIAVPHEGVTVVLSKVSCDLSMIYDT